jgi:hypothetical protein
MINVFSKVQKMIMIAWFNAFLLKVDSANFLLKKIKLATWET